MSRALLIFCTLLCLLGCGPSGESEPSPVEARTKLTILTTNQPTTYYIGRDEQPQGPEHDMAASLGAYLGLEVAYILLDSKAAVIDALARGEGDIAAAGLTVTDERANGFAFGPTYMKVSEYLVCRRSTSKAKSAEDIKELEIIVSSATSYIDTIQQKYPQIRLTVDEKILTPELLEKVRDREIQCTISDSTIFDINRRYYPEISKIYTLHNGSKLAWMLPKPDSELLDRIHLWFNKYKTSGELEQTLEKYYGYTDAFDYVDIQKFKRRIDKRLPKYKAMFIDAATKNDLSPALLAAQSYQESHWNPKAKSPTGVRGIMMLTLPVAKSLGVTSRLNAEQNIYAGAKYFAKMKNMFDDTVVEPDRTWMALAAYNVGRGHFRDAQGLARKLGKNPTLWLDMKEVLPLLSQKEYYKDLRYGYARGNEPVLYVNRIREYDDILAREFGEVGEIGEGD